MTHQLSPASHPPPVLFRRHRAPLQSVRATAVLLGLAASTLTLALMVVAASPAGAHPVEHCFFGWMEEDGVPVNGSPDDQRHICYDEYHPHPWRNLVIGTATLSAIYPLLYALIMTPEALWQEKATRRGRWRLIVHPQRLRRALPRRHWPAFFCAFLPAHLAGYVAAPPLLEWAIPPVSPTTVTLYVFVCGLLTVVGWRVWVHRRRQGGPAPSQQGSAPDNLPTSMQ